MSQQIRSAAAERMRRSRQRKRDGLRSLRIELRETEIDELIRSGFLERGSRNDRTLSSARSIGSSITFSRDTQRREDRVIF
jgi:SOS response regulatory protein OraA/RecX